MKVTAAVAPAGGGPFCVCELDLESPRDDEILVRISAAGLCHTDIVAQQGGFGFEIAAVLGHEGAGTVEAVGRLVTKVVPGDRVTLSFRSCGRCAKCESGHPAYCHQMPALNYAGMRADGSRALSLNGRPVVSNFFGQSSFATHALSYERNAVRLPDDIPFEIAAPLGCGVQTGAGSVLNVFRAQSGASIVVAGAGTVGLSAVMAAKIAGCSTIVAIDPLQSRRALARELGATHVIDPKTVPDIAAALREDLPAGADFALDTTGRQPVLEALLAALGPQGVLGCVGIPAPDAPTPGNLSRIIMLGHSVMGIIEGDADPEVFLPRLMEYYRAGRLPLDKLIACYPLSRIGEAVADQHAGRCTKIILTMN